VQKENMTEKEALRKLIGERDYLQEWLKSVKAADDAIPEAQKKLEMLNWQIEVLNNKPEVSDEIPLTDLPTIVDQDDRLTRAVFPIYPHIDTHELLNTTAVTTSGTAYMYAYLTRVGDLGTEDALDYSKYYIRSYQDIQNNQNRNAEVRKIISTKLSQNVLERFDRANASMEKYKSGLRERTATAMEFRTLLDGIKGDLIAMGKRSQKEDINWDIMVERVFSSDKQSTNYIELIRQGKLRSSLIESLSRIGKDREGSMTLELENLWIQILDHIFTILSLL
jgi:hypothetical protein